MATLTQLYTRLILETNRDDMGSGGEAEQAKVDAVARAIEFHADELFWFNRKTSTKDTVASTATIALPTGMRCAVQLSYNGTPLQKVQLEDIQYLEETGLPTKWAENDGAVQLWPIPDAVYTLDVFGIADLGVPASTNEWTTEAYDLIDATARKILYRDYFRDVEGNALAVAAEEEHLAKLRRETRKRGHTPLRSDIPVPSGFNINTGI
jgi:hypothetical protein